MSIPPFTSGRPRIRIGFIGTPPNDGGKTILECLGYEVKTLVETDLADEKQLALFDSVILFQDLNKPSHIRNLLEIAAPRLMEQGCRTYVGPAGGTRQAHYRQIVVNAVIGLELPVVGVDATSRPENLRDSAQLPVLQPCVHILADASDWGQLVRLIICNPADAPADATTIVEVVDSSGGAITLDPDFSILVRRAFFDCARVHMVREADGLSEVAVYRAFVELRSGAVGVYPYLYFVKVGRRDKVEKEYQQYQSTAMEYIPFHLGPRLRQDRCALGYNKGIIVGDYVTGAEKLRDCAKDGRAGHVIANLFNQTLHAWRVTAQPSVMSLGDSLANKWPTGIPDWREPEIRKLGAKKSLLELKELFLNLPTGDVLVGSIHGDLHATNVLARLSDGIVIDFEKVELSKPLVFDPASLEAGLFIDGFVADPRLPSEVFGSVAALYDITCFQRDGDPCYPKNCSPANRSAWFFDCARQIRLHARQMELGQFQYAAALALCFIRKSCNRKDFRDADKACLGLGRETVRAMAFFLGEAILENLSKTKE